MMKVKDLMYVINPPEFKTEAGAMPDQLVEFFDLEKNEIDPIIAFPVWIQVETLKDSNLYEREIECIGWDDKTLSVWLKKEGSEDLSTK